MPTSRSDDRSENEFRRLSAELDDSEARFRLLVESVHDYAIFMLDPGGRIISWNRGAARLKGYAADEIVGQHFSRFYTQPDIARGHPQEELRIAEETGRYREQGWRVRSDGSRFWADVTLTALRGDDGRLIGFAKVTHDVTEQRVAAEEREQLLRSERDARGEAERRAVQETALRDAVMAVSAAFTVEETTRRIAESALTATRADGAFVEQVDVALGQIVVTAVAGETVPAIGSRIPFQGSYTQHVIERERPDLVPRVADAERTLCGGLRERCGDCSAAVIPLLDAGEPIGSLVLMRNAEKMIFRADEIERAFSFGYLASLAFRKIHMLEDSERKREELQRVTESRARLMRGFSHDVKNPLGAADGFLSLLEDGLKGALSADQVESIGRSRRLLRSALGLIDDLLELARAEAGQLEVELAPTDVREATREMSEEYRAQAEKAGLTMELQVPDELSIIESDPTRVRQVVSNLVSNAIKYNSEGGHILIRVSADEVPGSSDTHGCVRVDVQDTGPGIAPEQQRLLFQEFSRLDPGETKGAGIGLAMAQHIARALDGRISVESEPGRGSTFTLRLPLRRVGERRGTGRRD